VGFLTDHNKSSSSNQAYNYLSGALSPTVSTGTAANDVLAGSLGIPGGNSDAAANGLQNYFNSAGGKFTLQQGTNAINNSAAAKGLLNSGATLKALQSFGQNTGQQYYQNYLSNLQGVANTGLQAGQIIGAAGQTSSSSGQGGLLNAIGDAGKGIGAIGTAFPSDRRLKRDIEKLDELSDGLGIYAYRYLGQRKETIGVMADEVARLRPWALGPKIEGFSTVRYDLLGEAA